MPVYLPGFHEVPARWFRGHKVGLHGPGAVQHVGDTKRCRYFANYDPRMKREGLHYVVVERDEKYMESFDEMVPEFIEKWTRHWLKLVLYLGSNGDDASSR